MNFHGIDISDERLAESCRKWKVTELSLFGSILRDDFRPDSDVDVPVGDAWNHNSHQSPHVASRRDTAND